MHRNDTIEVERQRGEGRREGVCVEIDAGGGRRC